MVIRRGLDETHTWRLEIPTVPGRAISGGWIPDLTDAATGGVLLSMLPPGSAARHNPRHVSTWTVTYVMQSRRHSTLGCATLAEAAARALLAVKR